LPDQAGTHNDVPIIEWLTGLATVQIHTPFCLPLAGAAVFPVLRHKPTLTSDSSPKIHSRLTPATIKLAAALGC